MVSRIEKRWVLPAFIVFGVLVVLFAGSKLNSPVIAKAEIQSGSNGEILVVPIQIERDKHGLAMLDMVNQTLWIYEICGTGPAHNRLRLFAARSWQYDRLLKQYNTAEPKPEQVRMLLEEEESDRKMTEQVQEQQTVSDLNTVEENEPRDLLD